MMRYYFTSFDLLLAVGSSEVLISSLGVELIHFKEVLLEFNADRYLEIVRFLFGSLINRNLDQEVWASLFKLESKFLFFEFCIDDLLSVIILNSYYFFGFSKLFVFQSSLFSPLRVFLMDLLFLAKIKAFDADVISTFYDKLLFEFKIYKISPLELSKFFFIVFGFLIETLKEKRAELNG